MLSKRNLVPIIGAGFTKGQPTSNATVPDGEEFRKLMLDALRGPDKTRDVDKIKSKQFGEIAKYFMSAQFVAPDVRKRIIMKYFTGVRLNDKLKDFLGANRPYIYTLNIDDAIEENSRFTFPVLP